MDFIAWGEEYLQEARALKARTDLLRRQLLSAAAAERKELNYRICLLYSMYLECRSTGRLLQSYGGKEDSGREK